MELMQAIETRRSVRAYSPEAVKQDQIDLLLHAAVQAPTGMNAQPWAFGVITDRSLLHDYSERVKAYLLSKAHEWDWLARYLDHLRSPAYNVFYNAPALITIYATNQGHIAQIDCALAAENLMLAACDMGLGSCWIGFAADLMNFPDVKRQLGVPDQYTAVAPIIVGYPAGDVPAPDRKPPEVLYRK